MYTTSLTVLPQVLLLKTIFRALDDGGCAFHCPMLLSLLSTTLVFLLLAFPPIENIFPSIHFSEQNKRNLENTENAPAQKCACSLTVYSLTGHCEVTSYQAP